MQINSFREKCDCCGKVRLIIKGTTVILNAGYEWEDSLYYADCWRCQIKTVVRSGLYRFKNFVSRFCFVAPIAFSPRAFKSTPMRRRVHLFKSLMKSLPR